MIILHIWPSNSRYEKKNTTRNWRAECKICTGDNGRLCISVNEQMSSSKARYNLKQCLPKKYHKSIINYISFVVKMGLHIHLKFTHGNENQFINSLSNEPDLGWNVAVQ